MIKKSKILALLLASAMLVTACGQQKELEKSSEVITESAASSAQQSSSEVEETSYFNATGYPIVNEEITLKILTCKNSMSTVDHDKMPGWQYLSELTGIKFEIESYTSDDLKTKLPLILSDPSSMPDIFLQCGISAADILNYGEQGMLMEISDLVEQYGEYIKICWEADPLNKSYATSTNGNIYALPALNYNGIPTGVWSYQVNTRWMENCGITEYPSTVEEFKDMLVAFRDMDANGNGDKDDEIPMMANMTSMLQVMAASFNMPLDWPWVGAQYGAFYGTTEAVPMFMTDNYRAMIEYIAELYEEKLINQDVFSVSGDENTARRVGDIYGAMANSYSNNVEEKYDPSEWVTIPLLTSEFLEDATAYAYVTPSYQTGMGAISAYTEYPEACIRVLDYFMSIDGTALIRGDLHDGTYDLKAAGVSQEIIDMYAEKLAVEGTSVNMAAANIFGSTGCNWKYQFVDYSLEGVYPSPVAESYTKLRKSYIGKEFYNPTHTITFTADEQDVLSVYQTDIDGYVQQTVSRWIAGEDELNDTTWNAYIAALEKMNVEEMTKAYVSAHNRFFGVK